MKMLHHSCTRQKAINQLIRYMITLFLIIPGYATAQDMITKMLETPAFSESFNEYYNALADYTVEDLRSELFETIEDTLSSGSHLSKVSMDYKTHHIETGLQDHLREALCATKPINKDLTLLKQVSARSVALAGTDIQINFNEQELGMLTGVTARLVEKMSHQQLCNGIE